MGKEQVESYIELLMHVARPRLVDADNGGGSKAFNAVSEEFGPVAYRVYLALEMPDRSCERYHHKDAKRVMLDPWTVLNRSRTFRNEEITIDDPEFWNHGDMIKTLIDYLALTHSNKEAAYVPCAART